MVKEFRSSQGMPDVEEHSHLGKAKRVIEGAIPFKINEDGRNIPPINQAYNAVSVSVELEADKLYRVISTTDCYIAISNDPSLAAVSLSDFFLPAKTAIVVSTVGNGVTRLAVVRDGSNGSLQIMEIG